MTGAVSTSRVLSWSLLALGAFLASSSRGEEPAVPQGAKPRFFTLNQIDAYFELESQLSRLKVRTDGRRLFQRNRQQINQESSTEERVGLQLSGTIVDPRFITFNTDLSFALTQDRFEEKITGFDQTDTDRDYLLQYDARVNFFQGKPISGTVYGHRLDDRINRRFQSTLNEQQTGFGTNWVFTHDKFPMEISYDYLETDRTGNRNQGDDEHFTESRFYYGLRWLISAHHRFKLSYDHSETKQEYQGLNQPFETTRDLFTLEHELEFGRAYQHELRTLIHWQEESGDFARDLFEIGPQLTLRHSDDLQTLYKFQFNRERFEGLDVETQRADFQLVHQMYTNLTTTVGLFGLYEDIENDINTTQYGANVDWQYNRKNRFGHLYANLALAYDTEDVQGDNGRRVVLDEAQTFKDPVAALLRNRNIVNRSIVVTEAGNRKILQRGRDYLVVRQGNVTRLVRVRNGRIDDGDTVFVDYQFETPTDGKLDTMRVDFSLEQRFTNGLTPYYRWSYRNQEDDSSFGFARRADRTDHHRLGVTYEAKFYTLGAEYEVFDDTIDPFDAFHLNGTWRPIRSSNHSLDLSSRISRLFFKGGFDERDVTMVDLEVDHRWQLTDSLSTVERLGFRLEDDSVAGETQGWDLAAGFEYVVGDLSGELTFEYDRLRLPNSTEDDIGLYFRIRRELPDVLASR